MIVETLFSQLNLPFESHTHTTYHFCFHVASMSCLLRTLEIPVLALKWFFTWSLVFCKIIIQVSPAPPAKNKPIQNEMIQLVSYGKKETFFFFFKCNTEKNMMRFYTNMQLMSISAFFLLLFSICRFTVEPGCSILNILFFFWRLIFQVNKYIVDDLLKYCHVYLVYFQSVMYEVIL